MIKQLSRAVPAATSLLFINCVRAFAHVKWFLGADEQQILTRPKPDLFTSICTLNMCSIATALIVFICMCVAARKFDGCSLTQKLNQLGAKFSPYTDLFLGLCTGSMLIWCALTGHLIAPNFVICAHCPRWLPYVEATVGFSLALGFLTRVGGCGLLWLLAFTFIKHGLLDCIDLVPIYGLAVFFVLSGGGRFSLDSALKLQQPTAPFVRAIAGFALSLAIGIGLIVLALDEKLIHPQLGMEVLERCPQLNPFFKFGLGNDLFVLCAGLCELCLGLMLTFGVFPRLAALALVTIFMSTTLIFGTVEFMGHLPYYAIFLTVLIRGVERPKWDDEAEGASAISSRQTRMGTVA